jgi:hypothetical protein
MATCPIGPTCTGCRKCDPRYAEKRAAKRLKAASFRTAVPHPYAAPDPYKTQLDAQRARDAKAAAAKTFQPAPRSTTQVLDANGIPDPYAAALEQMRSENR